MLKLASLVLLWTTPLVPHPSPMAGWTAGLTFTGSAASGTSCSYWVSEWVWTLLCSRRLVQLQTLWAVGIRLPSAAAPLSVACNRGTAVHLAVSVSGRLVQADTALIKGLNNCLTSPRPAGVVFPQTTPL